MSQTHRLPKRVPVADLKACFIVDQPDFVVTAQMLTAREAVGIELLQGYPTVRHERFSKALALVNSLSAPSCLCLKHGFFWLTTALLFAFSLTLSTFSFANLATCVAMGAVFGVLCPDPLEGKPFCQEDLTEYEAW
jgi:hypothetical protein